MYSKLLHTYRTYGLAHIYLWHSYTMQCTVYIIHVYVIRVYLSVHTEYCTVNTVH